MEDLPDKALEEPLDIYLRIRKLIREEKYIENPESFRGTIANVLHKSRKITSKKEFENLKKASKKIDVEIVSYLSSKPVVSLYELLKLPIPPYHLILRIEVMSEYEILEFNEITRIVSVGDKFGQIDVTNLPIHADQIPLAPRDKLVYRVVKDAQEFGGFRNADEIVDALILKGDICTPGRVYESLKKLRKLGIVDKSRKVTGYPIWHILEDIYIWEDYETLIKICQLTAPKPAKEFWKKKGLIRDE